MENGQYKLNTKILLKDEIIKFKIQNNYEKIPFILKSSIKSLDKNSCDKPEIQINQNDIYLTIKQNENDIDILNCILDIYISENIKISILINSIIISTYFDFYIYDYETKEFITDKNYIYIPSFEDKVTIELNFLINTFNGINQVGLFNIEEISEGITVDSLSEKIEINSNEVYFKKKLTFDMKKFEDKEIAIFEFTMNNITKKIELLEKKQKIENIQLNLIEKCEIKNKINIKNIKDIDNYSSAIFISPYIIWGKETFLYKKIAKMI